MARKGPRIEKIISRLREIEVLNGQGQTIPDACRKVGVSEQTHYRWRKEYGGLRVNQAKRMRDLEQENGYIESFNGKLRDELLDREIFDALWETQVLVERWREEYNTFRPHSSLDYRPPASEAIAWPSSAELLMALRPPAMPAKLS